MEGEIRETKLKKERKRKKSLKYTNDFSLNDHDKFPARADKVICTKTALIILA